MSPDAAEVRVDQRLLEAHQIRLYIQNTPDYLRLVVPGFAVAVGLLWPLVPGEHPKLLLWAAANFAAHLARLAAWLAFKRARPEDDTIRSWLKWFFVPQLWGVSVISASMILFLPASSGNDLELTFAFAGIMTAAALAGTLHAAAYRPLIAPVLASAVLIFAVGSIRLSGAVYILLAVAIVVGGLFVYRLGSSLNQAFVRSMELSIRNEYLVAALERRAGELQALHDVVQAQAVELAQWNATLEKRVQEQVGQLDRLGRLKRFFSPQLAELIVAGGAEDPLKPHRRDIAAVFVDLRGFTAFTESAEPEDVINVLHEYHAEMGRIIAAHEGTIERFIGDGIMVFFNDPVPLANPSENAVRMALKMKERFASLAESWRLQGFELGIGIGIARGYATIGAIGFEGRWDYSAIGGVTNLAARLCGEAKPTQILADRKAITKVESLIEFEPVGELALKGFPQPIAVFNITGLLCGAT